MDNPGSSTCEYKFKSDAQTSNWWDEEFYGDVGDLCYSNRNGTLAGSSGDRYFERSESTYNQSGACCNISQYGNEDYYFNEENVKVWG